MNASERIFCLRRLQAAQESSVGIFLEETKSTGSINRESYLDSVRHYECISFLITYAMSQVAISDRYDDDASPYREFTGTAAGGFFRLVRDFPEIVLGVREKYRRELAIAKMVLEKSGDKKVLPILGELEITPPSSDVQGLK